MGRTRKPLSEQKGNLTKEQQEKRRSEQELVKTPNTYFLNPPKWLKDKTAVSEYKRLVKALKGMDMLGDLDANNLAGYCNAFANYLKASEELETLLISGEKGSYENPLISVQIKYAKEMREFARLCGLSIDSRLKFAAVKFNNIDNNINDEFGGI